jgi:alpha-tubulin suppressor-like RCC1 family protein
MKQFENTRTALHINSNPYGTGRRSHGELGPREIQREIQSQQTEQIDISKLKMSDALLAQVHLSPLHIQIQSILERE